MREVCLCRGERGRAEEAYLCGCRAVGMNWKIMAFYRAICVVILLTLLTQGKDPPHRTHLSQIGLRSVLTAVFVCVNTQEEVFLWIKISFYILIIQLFIKCTKPILFNAKIQASLQSSEINEFKCWMRNETAKALKLCCCKCKDWTFREAKTHIDSLHFEPFCNFGWWLSWQWNAVFIYSKLRKTLNSL